MRTAIETGTRRYRHGDRVLEVVPGLLEKFTWMTGWRTQEGSVRFRSKYLPVRHSREQAQRDLDTYADIKNLEEVE